MSTGPLLRARDTDVSSRITRHCVTIAILVSLGRWEELEMHVRAALEQDLSQDQIAEVLRPVRLSTMLTAFSARRTPECSVGDSD